MLSHVEAVLFGLVKVVLWGELRHSKVSDSQPTVRIDEQIRRLQISMCDPSGVDVLQYIILIAVQQILPIISSTQSENVMATWKLQILKLWKIVRKESPSLPPPSPYFARLEGFQIVNAICFVENLIYNLHNIVMWFEFAFQIIKNIILYQTL